jgi:hypothetical protein
LELVITILQLAIILGGWFLYTYVKKLPDQVHAKNLKAFEYDLNKQLEEFRNQLTRDLELMKIKESQLHIHKTEEFTKLVKVLITKLIDKQYVDKLRRDQKTIREFNKTMLDLGTKLFFFASDDTVKKFVEWRKYGLTAGTPEFKPIKIITLLAELMVLIRKDLGYSQTLCDQNDFLHILLKDWSNYQQSSE